MERLTNRVGAGHVLYNGECKHYDGGDIPAEMSNEGIRDTLRRLADYEDTGLEPQEIVGGTDMQKLIDAIVEAIPSLIQAIVESVPQAVEAYVAAHADEPNMEG